MTGMDEHVAPTPVALKALRERTINTLCEYFANDSLELAYFESRLDRAHRAATLAELQVLTADLQTLAAEKPSDAPQTAPVRRAASALAQRASQILIAVMGGVARRGRWAPAQHTYVFAFWGGAELDFREADLPAGVTEVTVIAVMGGAEIKVPPDLHVETGGIAIMGGFEHMGTAAPASSNMPTLRINGLALMGGVDIQVRLPGETSRDARQRERDEKRRLRDEWRDR
jgi:hypothetical protein